MTTAAALFRQEQPIRVVATYLRKSRGETDKDLEKHRFELLDMCKRNGWTFVEYAEVGTSDSISARPKMTELLQDVEQDMFDAVVCMDIDRLSRGDGVDRARIHRTFGAHETLLITPVKVYDLLNDQDLMMAEFQGLAARMEYKAISRRFRQGKAIGAKMGFWTNGVPPFPYYRDAELKKAVPDEDKVPYYRMMVSWCLSGWSCTDIAWELNRMKVPSPRGGMWQPAVVRRMLLDKVHLGHMVVGKRRKIPTGDIVHKPKNEWIVYKNCHEPVKTEEEHDKIKFLINRDLKTPTAGRAGKHELSGLLKCGYCGRALQIQRNRNRPSDSIKSCNYRDELGNRCECRGGSVNVLMKHVENALLEKRQQITEYIQKGLSNDEMIHLQKIAQDKLREIRETERVIERVYSAYERMVYSKNEVENEEKFIERRDKAEIELENLNEELSLLQTQIKAAQDTRNEDMLISIDEVLEALSNNQIDTKERNRALKSIILEVIWTRERADQDPDVIVNFL